MEELNSDKAGWYGGSPWADVNDAEDGIAANLAVRGLDRSGLVYPIICELDHTTIERLRGNEAERVGRRRLCVEQGDT